MKLQVGDMVEISSSVVSGLVGETGVIEEIDSDGNCYVKFDNQNIVGHLLDRPGKTRGFSSDRLRLIADEMCDITEDDMAFILGV